MTQAKDRLVSLQSQYDSFDMYGSVIVVDTGDDFITLTEVGDIYDGLADLVLSGDKYPTAKGLAIITTGWAAPLGANGEVQGEPSKHPERRRVRLTAYVSCEGILSAIAFSDEEEVIYDDNGGTGTLAVALTDTWESVSQ